MGFLRQTAVLTWKNILIVLVRHWFSTTLRALVLPIVFMFFISYAKNFFVPPSTFGVGSPTPVRTFADGLSTASSTRPTVAFANNGYTGGDIDEVIGRLATTVEGTGGTVKNLTSKAELTTACPNSIRGVSQCYGAVSFFASPSEGPGNIWNYTIHSDGALQTKTFVDETSNDVEIYVIPFQHAIDAAIADVGGGSRLPDTVQQYPFTKDTQRERDRNITRLYQGTLIDIIAVAFFIGIVGITYQLVGHMASERELGISQLIEAMMPNRRRWQPQAARLIANHVAFDIIYLPSWVVMGLTVAYLVFPDANAGVIVVLHLLVGLALASFSLFIGAFFRKAQLSGITSTIGSLVLAIVAQIALGKHGSTGAVAILSLLFPSMNYTFFLINTAGFQQKTLPVDLTKPSPATDWNVSGLALWIFMIVQILVYPVLAACVERWLYSTSSKGRIIHHNSANPTSAVKLSSFSKHYREGLFKRTIRRLFRRSAKADVIAVNDLNLEIIKGQIAVLLGANGSGKSTTLDAIAGLNTITQGSIEVDGTGGLGLCPQKNVLWDELTVYEHVMLFNRLKTLDRKATRDETQSLIADCDLKVKMAAKSATLSGGQKRKLQLAMMFTGGSRVCCVDEVSSGIDPLARRKVWDILLAERGRRSILLTTHFLDEADILSDHIAILSRGVLKAEGTAVELKHRMGSGYRVSVNNDTIIDADPNLEGVPRRIDYDQTIYQFASPSEVSAFIATLENQSKHDYRVQGPTIEDVFLKVAEEIKLDYETPGHADEPKEDRSSSSSPTPAGPKTSPLDLLPGAGTGLFKQSWILFRKRWTVLRRNYLPYCAAVLLPIIAGALVTLFLKDFDALSCSPGASISIEQLESFATLGTADVPYGPPSKIPAELIRMYADMLGAGNLNASSAHPVSTRAEFNRYIRQNHSDILPGGIFLGQGGESPLFAYRINYDVYESIITQNLLNSVLTNMNIRTEYQPFSTPFAPKAGDTLQLILYFGLAMSAYVGFFALYPTAERLRKVRALHFSNGVRSGPLWAAYTTFDFLFVLLISAVIIIVFTAQWGGWYYPGYLFVVLMLFGLTSIIYSYVISLFVTSQLAAFAFAAGSQCILFLIYFIAYLAIITYAPVNRIDHYVDVAHFTIGIIAPSGNLARALLLTLNEFSLLCRGFEEASYPGDITVYGGPILYLIVQAGILMAFLVWYDSGGRLSLFKRKVKQPHDVEDTIVEDRDSDVAEELSRVQSSNDGLRVMHMTKAFGHNVAVEDATFGIRKGEVFALLGPNGAGKSTTISLIRGDIRPSASTKPGDVFVEGTPLSSHRTAARNHLGVCPQFDAIDQMTVLEHLRFYARVRGVSGVEYNVQQVINAVGLATYSKRQASKLSGGNKRKLSLAIALMGNPSVLLLDEPSSGMDAAAKRVMWRVLNSVTAGRALLITTHSMEEADALANRAGILARRMLALGTTDALRKKHGDAHFVHLVHEEAPHTSQEEMERVRSWVLQNIPGVQVEERTYHGQLRFSLPNRSVSRTSTSDKHSSTTTSDLEKSEAGIQGIGALFDLLESNKKDLRYAYYSVSPTTLDQVFLNVVMKHDIEEENYTRDHGTSKTRSTRFRRLLARS
ncbi:MAG: hypothetical protein M1828_006929 [Chrysothrix sp. TS-e1954]|nr:MAG: hypothetical protein M1828_006929 [Chrysothrix sp. TS-e1954]